MTSLGNSNSSEPIEEVVFDDFTPENFKPQKENEKTLTKVSIIPVKITKSKSILRKNARLRGLLPHKSYKSYSEILNLPIIKRCCIEHGYFVRNHESNPDSSSNLRNLPDSNSDTLQFENKSKSVEQTTIDVECLAPKLNSVYVSDSFNKNKVNGTEKEVSCRRSSFSNKNFSLNCSEGYSPENNSAESDTDVASVHSCDSVKQIYETDTKKFFKNSSCNDKKKDQLNSESTNASRISNKFYNINYCFRKITNMQKLLKAKYVSEKGKTGKIPPPRLKKMMGQKGGENILKMSEYLFPMPNLTKMANGEKNWRMEYLDDEVQNIGLDDLLLKASELNAENFTKALGQKLEPTKAAFNNKDSSEVVFTIPKTKNISDDNCESSGDISKQLNLKTIKLDISKPFYEPDKSKEAETVKPADEINPKKPGIKIKTVENINEEFKDSLGRLNGVEKEIPSSLEKTPFGVPIKEPEKEKNSQETEKDTEGSRPFIMTIIQSKTEKQTPAILRNSYLKKKANLEKQMNQERILEKTIDCRVEGNLEVENNKVDDDEGDANRGEDGCNDEKTENNADLRIMNSQLCDKSSNFGRNLNGEGYVSYPRLWAETENEKDYDKDGKFPVKRRNIPFIIKHNRKVRQTELTNVNNTQSKLVKVAEGSENPPSSEKAFKITSTEQKLGPKENNRRFIKVVPYEPVNKPGQVANVPELVQKLSDDEPEAVQKDTKSNLVLSLTSFSTILKEILPDKWFLCMDKKYGLEIIKTHIDEYLNPSILISVIVARSGKVTVNVRGKQLPKTHELFSNICDISNSENKLSINYILTILNRLRHRSVCFGCDDPSLKKYWSDDVITKNQTDSQQVLRSQLCQLLVSLGRRRCFPCYRMNESLKKRYRRDKRGERAKEDKEKDPKEVSQEGKQFEETQKTQLQQRGVKRNLEDFLEESFSTMKQQITDELEKNKKLGERENALKAQEEVLSFMGLTRKESLDNSVRKSKRKKNSFYKFQQPMKKKIDQKELEFLEKYWSDINTLFSTSLLFGAYSRTGRGRLREKCKMFQKLLSTWKNIIMSNPEWIGEISFPDDPTVGESLVDNTSSEDQFEKMDVPALRAYIINSVKEVNRIKLKLRTRNSYFKVLYNKFVKRRMKRPKILGSDSPKKENVSSENSTTNTSTPTDFSSDENSRDKEKINEENQSTVDLSGSSAASAAD